MPVLLSNQDTIICFSILYKKRSPQEATVFRENNVENNIHEKHQNSPSLQTGAKTAIDPPHADKGRLKHGVNLMSVRNIQRIGLNIYNYSNQSF